MAAAASADSKINFPVQTIPNYDEFKIGGLETISKDIDLKNLPGILKENTFTFPPIDYIDARGGKCRWQIKVRLFTSDKKPLNIQPIFYDGYTIPNAYAELVPIYGRFDNQAEHHITKISEGKNLNKSNRTNVFTQALHEAMGKVNDYVKKHRTSLGERIKPMLLHTYAQADPIEDKDGKIVQYKIILDERKSATNLNFETEHIFVQPKLDGVRAMACLKGDGSLDCWSRELLDIKVPDELAKQLLAVLLIAKKIHPDKTFYLDFEFFKEGIRQQHLSSTARRIKNDDLLRVPEAEAHIFDSVLFKNAEMVPLTFIQSQTLLDTLLTPQVLSENNKIKRVETILVKSIEDVIQYFVKFLQRGYEGAVIRRGEYVYVISSGSKRSDGALKLKPFVTETFTIVGYLSGKKGDAADEIIFVLALPDGTTFKAEPTGDIGGRDIRKAMLAKMTTAIFEQFLKGKKAKVRYLDKSEDQIPEKARVIELIDVDLKNIT